VTDLELAFTPAVDLARLIAARTLSPVELVSNSLSRIGDVNPRLNCFCFVWEEAAVEAAHVAAQAVARGETLGPLHGVPVALKDTTPTAGHRTTLGSYTHEQWIPERDAYIVRALRRAGAIIVGKTTTPEFAHTLITDSPLWGATRNPWNLERTPGGSSGGSAASFSSQMSAALTLATTVSRALR
jgi:Asp-tRNA(Asn)/Glu-tRNA(Gln) amidotransferase A subunit family amidase